MRRPPTRWLVRSRTFQPGQTVGALHWMVAMPETRVPVVASAASSASMTSTSAGARGAVVGLVMGWVLLGEVATVAAAGNGRWGSDVSGQVGPGSCAGG